MWYIDVNDLKLFKVNINIFFVMRINIKYVLIRFHSAITSINKIYVRLKTIYIRNVPKFPAKEANNNIYLHLLERIYRRFISSGRGHHAYYNIGIDMCTLTNLHTNKKTVIPCSNKMVLANHTSYCIHERKQWVQYFQFPSQIPFQLRITTEDIKSETCDPFYHNSKDSYNDGGLYCSWTWN